jgi:HEPN domain-containing protein
MNVTPEALDWVRKAEGDLVAALRLARGEDPLPDQAGFFCQQAAEKYLKAFLIAAGQTPPRIHDVDALLEMCAEKDPAFDRLRLLVEGLTEFAVAFRYPGEWSDLQAANRALTQAHEVRALVREKMGLGGSDLTGLQDL